MIVGKCATVAVPKTRPTLNLMGRLTFLPKDLAPQERTLLPTTDPKASLMRRVNPLAHCGVYMGAG